MKDLSLCELKKIHYSPETTPCHTQRTIDHFKFTPKKFIHIFPYVHHYTYWLNSHIHLKKPTKFMKYPPELQKSCFWAMTSSSTEERGGWVGRGNIDRGKGHSASCYLFPLILSHKSEASRVHRSLVVWDTKQRTQFMLPWHWHGQWGIHVEIHTQIGP